MGAMAHKGLVVMAPVANHAGVFVRLDGKDLGLKESYPLLERMAVRVNSFVGAMAKMKKKISVDMHNKSLQHFTLNDFNKIFKATCWGSTSATAKTCAAKSKA